jgi:hypothetical protein
LGPEMLKGREAHARYDSCWLMVDIRHAGYGKLEGKDAQGGVEVQERR